MITSDRPYSTTPVHIVVVDNVDIIRLGLMSLSYSHPHAIASVRAYATVDEIDLNDPAPAVVVLDLWLGPDEREPSYNAVPRLKQWGAAVLLYTSETTPYPLQLALKAGIDGLFRKIDGIDALVEGIISVSLGLTCLTTPLVRAIQNDSAFVATLTPAEIDVLKGLSYGKTLKEIAKARQVTVKTVGSQVESIHSKYGGSAPINLATVLKKSKADGYTDDRLKVERPRKIR